MKTVGILGGMGPETTSKFYLKVIELCRLKNKIYYPPIIINSLPIPYTLEKDIVEKGESEERLLPILIDGVKKLEQLKADFIVIPCNTVHIFIDELRKNISTPILSIVEETVAKCKIEDYKKVGILATKKAIEKKLYNKELERRNIKLIVPDLDEQQKVTRIIYKILNGNKSEENKKELLEVIQSLKSKGVEAVILGCTDLQLVINKDNSSLPLLDTVEILVEASVSKILE
ncbi:hypothetical protein AMJ49_03660 [Parcubacteria bacterium DG_74_2]|nr:MAG: hypothetical protein AMJ49_03660 [Parcubacteria bacterium DG_74_2]